METVYLHGSETVAEAATAMQRAADDMRQAASQFDDTLRTHRQWMDDWLARFQVALEGAAKVAGGQF